jgi:hypothetical protein
MADLRLSARFPRLVLVLQASLALCIFGGLGDAFPLRGEGGLLNAIVLLLFIATIIANGVRGSRDATRRAAK